MQFKIKIEKKYSDHKNSWLKVFKVDGLLLENLLKN